MIFKQDFVIATKVIWKKKENVNSVLFKNVKSVNMMGKLPNPTVILVKILLKYLIKPLTFAYVQLDIYKINKEIVLNVLNNVQYVRIKLVNV